MYLLEKLAVFEVHRLQRGSAVFRRNMDKSLAQRDTRQSQVDEKQDAVDRRQRVQHGSSMFDLIRRHLSMF